MTHVVQTVVAVRKKVGKTSYCCSFSIGILKRFLTSAKKPEGIPQFFVAHRENFFLFFFAWMHNCICVTHANELIFKGLGFYNEEFQLFARFEHLVVAILFKNVLHLHPIINLSRFTQLSIWQSHTFNRGGWFNFHFISIHFFAIAKWISVSFSAGFRL